MSFDLSLLNNVNFTSKDSLWFLAVFFIIIVIMFAILAVVIIKVIKIFKTLIKKIFGINEKKAKVENNQNQKAKSIQEEQSATVNAPVQKPAGDVNFKIGEKTVEGKSDARETFKEKEGKSIAEHLNKLQTDKDGNKETLESKMPSRTGEKKEEGFSLGGIKIAKKKVFPTAEIQADGPVKEAKNSATSTNEIRPDGLVGGTGKKDIFGNELSKKAKANAKARANASPFTTAPTNVAAAENAQINTSNDSQSQNNTPATTKKAGKNLGAKDTSIFEGQKEVSRIKLRHKLRYDPKIYQAQKDAGLYNLDRAARERLEKEVFAPVYGRNISKTDLNLSLKKLGRKLLDAKDPAEHAKIRKEIKFFRKIGGIKN